MLLDPNVARLSGLGIRKILYLAAAPGNHLLAVSTTKGGLNLDQDLQRMTLGAATSINLNDALLIFALHIGEKV